MRQTAPELPVLGTNSLNYDPDLFEINDPLMIYMYEIKNILSCQRGEVIGAMDKGADLESLVYEMGLSEDEINSRIMTQIKKYCTMSDYFNTKIQTKFGKGIIRDICVINIDVDGTKMNFVLK